MNDLFQKKYEQDVLRDKMAIEAEKKQFIKMMQSGLGQQAQKFESYKKKTPSKLKKFWIKLKLVLWNV